MDITSFSGEYEFLSNFYSVPVNYKYTYGSAEAAYQAQKSENTSDALEFTKYNPGKAKIWRRIYDHHAPGISKSINVQSIVKKVSGSKNDRQYHTEFIVSWKF